MKVFQIGFNKSGTTSLHKMFCSNGFSSVHWDRGRLSSRIKNNVESGRHSLEGYDDFKIFSDMEHNDPDIGHFYSYQYYKKFDEDYPGSIFILNIRGVDGWINSRLNHGKYLLVDMLAKGKNKEQIVQEWREHYYEHVQCVKKYFEGRDDLIVFDIESDSHNTLFAYLESKGFSFKDRRIPHTHKTEKRESLGKEVKGNLIDLMIKKEKEGNLKSANKVLDVLLDEYPGDKWVESRSDMYHNFNVKK